MKNPKLRFPEFKDPWKKNRLRTVVKSIDSGWSPDCEKYPARLNEWGVLKTTSVTWEGFNENENKKLPNELQPRPELKVCVDDVLVTRAGPSNRVGVVAYVASIRRNLMLSDKLIRIRLESQSNKFFTYLLGTNSSQKQLRSKSSGLATSQTNISQNILLNTIVNYPQVDEQQKIADFLSAVDKKIELLNRKKELLEQDKKGVMQKLFSREIRFRDENGRDFPEWKKLRLGQVFIERNSKGYNDHELLSVTIRDGVIKRSEIDSHDNSSSDKSNYKLVLSGDVVYNSMRMWQGASGVSKYDGIVSPAYTVMAVNNGFSPNFIGYMFKLPHVIFTFQRYSQGLTSDTWNLKFHQLSPLKFDFPCYDEQLKIANFLEILDEKINVQTKEIELVREFKKGLLQQMFV